MCYICGLLDIFLKWPDLFHYTDDNIKYSSMYNYPKLLPKSNLCNSDFYWNINSCFRFCAADKERKQYLHHCTVLRRSIDYRPQLLILTSILWPISFLCDSAIQPFLQCFDQMYKVGRLHRILVKQLYLFHFRCNLSYNPLLHHYSKHMLKYQHRHDYFNWNNNTCSRVCNSHQKCRQNF